MKAARDQDGNDASEHQGGHEGIIQRDFKNHNHRQQRGAGGGGEHAAHADDSEVGHRQIFAAAQSLQEGAEGGAQGRA